MRLKEKVLVIILFCLIISSCTYQKRITITKSFGSSCQSPSKNEIVFFRGYKIFKNATGINALPDGGIPKYFHQSLSIYIYDIVNENIRQIAFFDSIESWPYRWSTHISWKQDNIVFWMAQSHWDNTKQKLIEHDKGIYLLNSGESNYELLVKEGKMPDISPDGKKIVYHKVTQEEGFEIYTINSDGNNNRLIKKGNKMDLAYTRWDAGGLNILIYTYSPSRSVYKLIMDSQEIENTNIPFPETDPDLSTKTLDKYTKWITDKEWGILPLQYCRQNNKTYVDDLLMFRGNQNYRNAIIDKFGRELDPGSIKKILEIFNKHVEKLESEEKYEYLKHEFSIMEIQERLKNLLE